MPRNDDELDVDGTETVDETDRDDAAVRGDNDPPTRGRTLEALERETEVEFESSEAGNTGGGEHRSPDERPAEREAAGRPPEAEPARP